MKVYPVVHITEVPLAVEQADLAFELGADGIYLIDHGRDATPGRIFETFNKVVGADDDRYVGVNLLGYRPGDAAMLINDALRGGQLSRTPDGLWADDVLSEDDPAAYYDAIKQDPRLRPMRYLGGVAFKYTPEYTDDPVWAAEQAIQMQPVVDVVTTSGSGTGSPPPIAKIAAMKHAISGNLAVASGISIDNMHEYAGIVDEVLVASSVETAPYSGIFDPDKLRTFIDQAHSL